MKAAFFAICALLAVPAATVAQERYPSRPVTIIVPYGPGGAADIAARPLAQALERELGQPFLVVNRAGASGAIGTAQVAGAAPDGYTLMVAVVQMSVLPDVDVLFGRKPSYSREQFAGIARLTAEPVVYMAKAQAPWASIKEMIDDARKRPGKITYGTGGAYAGNHLPFAMLAQAAGAELVAVPYKGGGPSMLAALSGEVDMTAQTPGVALGHVRAGKVRALAHSGAAPLKDLPEVPTLKSLGLDVEFYLWAGFFAPANMPATVLATLRDATDRAMRGEVMRTTAAKMNLTLAYQGAEEFTKWWSEDAARLSRTVRTMGKIE